MSIKTNSMKLEELKERFEKLHKNYEIFAPVRREGRLQTDYINTMKCVELNAEIPDYSFKQAFFPSKQILFNFNKEKLRKHSFKGKEQLILGMSLPDAHALELYHRVFAKDLLFSEGIEKSTVIGIAREPVDEFYVGSLPIDAFLFIKKDNDYDFGIVTRKGQKIAKALDLKEFKKIKNRKFIPFRHFEFFKKVKQVMESDDSKEIFDELGKRCIECGKCTIACPTCFCFRLDDEPGLSQNKGMRIRTWDACFYHEFSEVAGGHRFLDKTSERIKFWYYHKFVRIPNDYQMTGCVSCGRCSKVCPVGINLPENLLKIVKVSEKNKK